MTNLAHDTLPVSEIFGPTFQGEGPSSGRVAAFVRLGGCNLTCRDCDTPYTWDASRFDLRAELTSLTVEQILARLPAAPLVVISGGEPTLYRDRAAMSTLLEALVTRTVEVETNGTLDPYPMDEWAHVRFNVSPKLAGPMSDDDVGKRIRPAALTRYGQLARDRRAVWKLVVDGPESARQALELTDAYQVPRHRVWFMPAGTTIADTVGRARVVADAALAAGVNLTLRQHVVLWPDVARGK